MGKLTAQERCAVFGIKERSFEHGLPEDIRIRDIQTALNIIDRFQNEDTSFERKLKIVFNSAAIEVKALIDSGNRLREPISEQPVLIVSEQRIKKILPEETYGARYVYYASMGGRGKIKCFLPETLAVFRNGIWNEIRGIWIGVYPELLPGCFDAIAPIEVQAA